MRTIGWRKPPKLDHNQDAFKEMSQVVELDPNHLKARVALGGMYLASGPHFYSNAEEQARFVVDHDPNNAEAYLLLGNVLLAQAFRRCAQHLQQGYRLEAGHG